MEDRSGNTEILLEISKKKGRGEWRIGNNKTDKRRKLA